MFALLLLVGLTHSMVVMLNSNVQQKILQEMLLAAQQAKDNYTNVQRTAREAVGLGGQSFFSGSDTRSVSAFPSQAETTLTRYSQSGGNQSGGGKGEKPPISCFGCGGPHLWSEYIEGKHVVTSLTQGLKIKQSGTWRNTMLIERSSQQKPQKNAIWQQQTCLTLTKHPNSVFGSKSFS